MTDYENDVHGMSSEELDGMLARYNIGKKPLARLLGWGETAIINLKPENGMLPQGEYTQALQKLNEDPVRFCELLTDNRSAVTETAYNKSLEAMRGIFRLSDITEAAHYVCMSMKNKDISALRLESILLWSQIYSLFLLNEPVFDNETQISENAFFYPKIADMLLKNGCIRPSGLYPSDNTCEPKEQEKAVLDRVAAVFSWYGEPTLEALNTAEHKKILKLAVAEPDQEGGLLKKYAVRILNRSKVSDIDSFEKFLHTRIITAMNNSDKHIANALVTLDKMRQNGKRKP
ncbi:MAG: hypothetical protein K6G81_11065 [Lachnospiraceae bacterium]|nr:hypothetical protein [Lachnospiraceae bacterium]